MIIAIDGPAGAGKSTVARGLARRLGFRFLDTGALYRAVALAAIENELTPTVATDLVHLVQKLNIRIDGETTWLGTRDVSREIRHQSVSEAASQVASLPEVRDAMTRLQREIAAGGNYVCEGRDQGSVVFPDAKHKFYVTASLHDRAHRRWNELTAAGSQITFEDVIEQLTIRDERDSTRPVGALVKAADAIEIDTGRMTADQVVDVIAQHINENSKN